MTIEPPTLKAGEAFADEVKQTIQPVAQRWRDVELIALLDTWLADESGLDEAVLPQLQRDLEANRIALHAVDAARSRTP